MAKKLLALLLGVCMLTGVLAGCGSKGSESSAGSEGSSAQAEDSGGEDKETQKKDEAPVALRLVMYGEAGVRNTEFWENEFHEKVLEDLNLDVTIEYLPWGSIDKVATMLASGEKFGFMNILTQDPTFATNGYLATFDEDMIREIGPKYLEARMGAGFEFVKWQGEIVTIPVGGMIWGGPQDNFSIRNDILNEVGWDYTQIQTYDDLMAACAAVHEKYPDLYIIGNAGCFPKALNSVYAPDAILKLPWPIPPVVLNQSEPDSDEVISFYESQWFHNLVKIYREWHDLGYIKQEHITNSPTNPQDEYNNGNGLINFGGNTSIYRHDGMNEQADVRYLVIGDTPSVISNNYDWGWAVSAADQENVEHYVRLINWIYESEENYRFCLYGVEGKDYTVLEDGSIDRTTTDDFIYGWQSRTFLYEKISEKYDAAEIERYLHFDEDCIVVKEAGFIFDSSPVDTQAAQMNAIIQEKVIPLMYGMGDFDSEWPAVLQELKDAGLDQYVAEYQRQFSEFMANK